MIGNSKTLDLDKDIISIPPSSLWYKKTSANDSNISAHEYYFINMLNGKTLEQLQGDLRRKEKEVKGLEKLGLSVPESKVKEIEWLKQQIKFKEQEETKNGK